MKTVSYQGRLDKQFGGIYRVKNNRIVPGKARYIFINNSGYYLTQIGIYADGMIDCWGLVDFLEFKKKVEKGWATTSVSSPAKIDIHLLSSLHISKAENYISPKELIKEIEDTIAELNGKPTSLELCRSAYEAYLVDSTVENKKELRKAYYAMPEHMRHFVLGDMEAKDSPITSIIDQVAIDEVETNFPFEKDERFIDLYTQVVEGKLPYYWAVIDIEAIKPFTEARTEANVTESFRKHFIDSFHQGKPISIHVYPKDRFFIMSDDYSSFALYKELGVLTVPCLVLGEPLGSHVKRKIRLKKPTD